MQSPDDNTLANLFAETAETEDAPEAPAMPEGELPGGAWQAKARNIASEDGLLSCELQR